jgi:hypothetical protein
MRSTLRADPRGSLERLTRRPLRLFGSVLVALLLFEGGLRVAGIRVEAPLYTRDRIVGFALRPFAAAWPVMAAPTAAPASGISPGSVRAYATIHSIGIEWEMTGDSNHDARAAVQYRARDTKTWASALDLVRVDYKGFNGFAGSVLFLEPDTTYEIMVNLSDPDGGGDSRVMTIRTRSLPSLPARGRTLHVVPGSGGGDGSVANPFRGVAAAQAVARPGDIFLVHAGDYGGRIAFNKGGTAGGNHIVWKGAGDGETRFDGIDIAASHLWIEGVTIRNRPNGIYSIGAPTEIVVTRNRLVNNHYGIHLGQGGSNWYIADNDITGDTDAASESLSGEGIELNHSSGHVVAHNRITRVADGISSPDTNVDIYGNDIFDTSDDGIEVDGGGANVRIWGNRVHNAVHTGISFQPQAGAPWYIIRNQLVGFKYGAFKFRTTDRFVLLHNTIVTWGSMTAAHDDHLLRGIARNNLWISATGGQIWWFGGSVKDWRTDLNYDGFDWGSFTLPFVYAGVAHGDVSSLAAASGLEKNGTRVNRSTCFEAFDVPGPPPASIPPQSMTLKADCEAVDAGTILPNVNDGFVGAAPDLGAYEHGRPVPRYGPRPTDRPR